MTNLIQQIEKAFAESDAQAIAEVPALIVEARQQYREMKAEYFAIPHSQRGERQTKMEAIKDVFSVKFRNDFDWGEAEHINRHIAAVKKAHEQRNARIVAKFNTAGIESIDVDNFKVVYGQNFEGMWLIDGFRVKIEVILAGGYNIQRLHPRVLVNIKEMKKAA
jgi:hypothetical protein